MTTQPEALRLADVLDTTADFQMRAREAAIELRRLYEVNQELLGVLQTILNISLMDKGHWAKTIEQEAHTAIAKATSTGESK